MNRLYTILLSAVMISFAVGGCATIGTKSLPVITPQPTEDYSHGRFVWFDLLSEDIDVARKFYTELFDWRIRADVNKGNYLTIHNGSRTIGGIVAHENRDPQVVESMWIGSLSVDDVDRAAAAVYKHGGTVLDGPLDVLPRGRMALVADPAGAVLALLRTDSGDPADEPPREGDWLWTDLIIDDAQQVTDFYYQVAGFRIQSIGNVEQQTFSIFVVDRKARAGLVVLEWEGIEANWLPYIRVNDLDVTITKARQLDGRLIYKHDDVAVLADPTGAAFGIQELPKDGAL